MTHPTSTGWKPTHLSLAPRGGRGSVPVAPCVSAVFEEPEDPSNRSFFSEIISSVSDVKFSHSGRYMLTRDYLTVKVWDLNMEARPIETYQVGAAARGISGPLYGWESPSRPSLSGGDNLSHLQGGFRWPILP